MKDPAALFYIDKYLIATAEMTAECVGWYTKLILHQYDKKDLPNDVELLAGLCNVRFSDFGKFKQVWGQVLKQKFLVNENNRLEQGFAKEILMKREKFIEKRTLSGKLGYILKYAKNKLKCNDLVCEFIKENIDVNSVDLKDKQMLEQVLKQTIMLYIDVDKDKDSNIVDNKESTFELFWDLYDKKVGDKNKIKVKWDKLKDDVQTKAIRHIENYKIAQPDKQFRKNPEAYINNKSWNDEIIGGKNGSKYTKEQLAKFAEIEASYFKD